MSLQLQGYNHRLLDGPTPSEEESWEPVFKQHVEWRVKNGIHFAVMLQATADYIRVQGCGWVPSSTPECPKLGSWVNKMRLEKRKGKLSTSQKLALESIGFLWEEPPSQRRAEPPYQEPFFSEAMFAKMLQATAEYIQVQGHGWIPWTTPENPKLGSWATNVRLKKRKGTLSISQTLALESIGFLWEEPPSQRREDPPPSQEPSLSEALFAEMLQATAKYIQVQGHGWVPSRTPEYPRLGIWVDKMRSEKRKGTLSISQKLALESIGFLWEEPPPQREEPPPSQELSFSEGLFAEMLQATAKYIQVQGHGWVPSRIPEYPQLGIWASNIRKKKRRGKVSTSDTLALENIGFLWKDPQSKSTPFNDDAMFAEMLQAMREYIRSQGHGWVPYRTPKCPKIGQWANDIRKLERKRELSISNKLALENIGFLWKEPKTQSTPFNEGAMFAEMLQATTEYIRAQGHGWVPLLTRECPKLGLWAHDIRKQERKGELSISNKLALENIGFLWKEPQALLNRWKDTGFAETLQTAKEYIRVRGNGWIPLDTPGFPKLGRWARDQRSQKRTGQLSASRQLALDNIGFMWEQKVSSSFDEAMLQAATEYIQAQGHGCVPLNTPEFPSLGSWARYQRSKKSTGSLSMSTQLALERIGFAWEETMPPPKNNKPSSSSSSSFDLENLEATLEVKQWVEV